MDTNGSRSPGTNGPTDAAPFALLCSLALHLGLLFAPAGAGESAAADAAPAPPAVSLPQLQVELAARAPLPKRPRQTKPPVASASPRPVTAAAAVPPPAKPPEPVAADLPRPPVAPSAHRGLVDPVPYYRASQLTVPPGIDTLGSLEPPEGRGFAGGGRVVLELFVDPQGGLDDFALVEDTAPPAFREHVLRTFAAARYTPGMLLGVPVKARFRVEVSLAR